jgi:hypothetical protein
LLALEALGSIALGMAGWGLSGCHWDLLAVQGAFHQLTFEVPHLHSLHLIYRPKNG